MNFIWNTLVNMLESLVNLSGTPSSADEGYEPSYDIWMSE